MSWNGSGVFNINTSGQPVSGGTVIDATVFNTLMTDIASGLSNCITKDGQQTVSANIPMNSKKFTGLAVGTASTDSARVDNANILAMCEFRMTLTTATPVTTADVTAATTIYVSPYKGNRIALYDGSDWHMRSSAEMSIAVPATTSTMYDLFCYDNAGTPTLETLVWTSDTARATALVLQDGVLSKSGVTTRRYLGSFRTTGVSGQTEDSVAKRYVWNYYNRVMRPMRVTDSNSYAYTTNTLRQARNSTANQLDFVMGYAEEPVPCNVSTEAANATGAVTCTISIGLDSTTAAASGVVGGTILTTGTSSTNGPRIECHAMIYPDVGRHFLAWLEKSAASGSTTWNETGTAGIYGHLFG